MMIGDLALFTFEVKEKDFTFLPGRWSRRQSDFSVRQTRKQCYQSDMIRFCLMFCKRLQVQGVSPVLVSNDQYKSHRTRNAAFTGPWLKALTVKYTFAAGLFIPAS